MKMNMYDIEKDALESLKESLEYHAELDDGEIYFSGDDNDIIFEVCDSSVPIYTYDLMQLAADNISLAVDEPELGPAFDGTPTPVNIVAANVSDAIMNHLWENLEDIKKEIHQELLEDENICIECNKKIEDNEIIGLEFETQFGETKLVCLLCYEEGKLYE
jgi:hypothetical protein